MLTVSDEEVVQIDFSNPENQLEANKLFIGFTTKLVLNRLAADTVEQRQIKKFYAGVTWQLYHTCKDFPIRHEVLYHASFCNFELRMEADISSIEFFIKRYPVFFASLNLDELHDEFVAYKTSPALTPGILKSATITETKGQDFLIMDVVWDHLSKEKDASGNFKFHIISRVAKLVLTIPHSNADAERVFRIIGKNKVKSMSDLALEGTLSSLTTCKVNQFFDGPCYQFEPSTEILDKAKEATLLYNKAHQ